MFITKDTYCVQSGGLCDRSNCCMMFTQSEDELFGNTIKLPDDKVYKPSHYAKWKIEPITFIVENGMEFWRGNIIKYTARAGAKAYDGMDLIESEITDLEKVRRYAEIRINNLKGIEL